jgi:hypothetical protein
MLACPRCRRHTFTRRDLVSTALDGTAQCRSCSQPVRLDMFSRWLLSCVIALILPGVLLYGDLFYSGHLFVVSLLFVFAAWAGLSYLCCPLLTLERAPTGQPIDRRTGMLILVVLLAAAGIIDNFMAARFDAEPLENARSTSAAQGHR